MFDSDLATFCSLQVCAETTHYDYKLVITYNTSSESLLRATSRTMHNGTKRFIMVIDCINAIKTALHR